MAATEIPIDRLCGWLAEVAPLGLAESWDNVGLLVGDRRRPVRRVLTCLTVTPPVVAEAARGRADLIVAHHPLPFKPLARLTTDTVAGRMLLELAAARIALYSAHTAFDSAATGINQRWAERLGLVDVRPLVAAETADGAETPDGAGPLGAGRFGRLEAPTSLAALAERVRGELGLPTIRFAGAPDAPVSRVATACGSGGSFLAAARRQACDALLTGEANFHACLEAEATGVGMILTGHFASERFAMEEIGGRLQDEFPQLTVWASTAEKDPIHSLPKPIE